MRTRWCLLAMTGMLLVLSVWWAPAASAARSITVTPSTGLVDQQSVSVDVAGFTPGSAGGVCQAVDLGAPRGTDECGNGSLVITGTAPDGSIHVTFSVRRFLYIPRIDRIVDCARPGAGCVIAAAEGSDIEGTFVGALISFASAPPPPIGTITLTPNSDLVTGQGVNVAGSGFAPNAPVILRQCVAAVPDLSDCGHSVLTGTDSSGAFSFPSVSVVTPLGTTVCAPAGTCEMRAYQNDTPAKAPLSFRTFQPDGQIVRFLLPNSPIGNDIYNLDASGQQQTRPAAPGARPFFGLRIQSDGIQNDNITVTGQGSSPLFTVRYFVGYYNVTSLVTGGGLTFTGMTPGQVVPMAVDIQADATAPAGATKNVLVTSTSAGDPAKKDVVQVGVVVSGGTN